MIDMYLVHMSDLHFSGDFSLLQPDEALKLAGNALVEHLSDAPLVLAISGDITTKGEPGGFHEALESIERNFRDRIIFDKVVVCPGNHDIVDKDKQFVDFNKFSFGLTDDYNQSWNSDRPVCTVDFGGYSFVLINSAYRGDYRSGAVPLEALEQALRVTREKHRIVMIHHSPISSAYGGGGLEEAYELLSMVARENAVALLHGHVHSDQVLKIGSKQTLVSGAASLAFSPAGNMNNQFCVYAFDEGCLKQAYTYTYTANKHKFLPTEMILP